MKNDKSQNDGLFAKMAKAVISGTIIGAIMCMLMLIIVSFVFVKIQSVPETAVVPAAIFIACAGAFVGGYFAARIRKSTGMAVGAISALLMFIILLLVGMLFMGDNFGVVSFLRMVLMLLSGAIGGVLGVNKRKRRK